MPTKTDAVQYNVTRALKKALYDEGGSGNAMAKVVVVVRVWLLPRATEDHLCYDTMAIYDISYYILFILFFSMKQEKMHHHHHPV